MGIVKASQRHWWIVPQHSGGEYLDSTAVSIIVVGIGIGGIVKYIMESCDCSLAILHHSALNICAGWTI